MDRAAGQCRVVLVRPPINRSPHAPFFLPLGLLCVTAPLRDAGHDVEIVDYEFLTRAGRFRLDDETWLADVCAPLLDRAPQLIVSPSWPTPSRWAFSSDGICVAWIRGSSSP